MHDYMKIPDQGTVFAVYRDRIVYGKYQKSNADSVILQDGTLINLTVIAQNTDLLELHLFDQSREYRCVRTRQRGMLESLIEDKSVSAEYEDSYMEEIYVLEKGVDQQEQFRRKVGVVNYIHYNADDLAVIDQYRLKEVE
ncbi:MAG: hypothetical protein Q4E24_01340 [bacterium]|nr:hypothetical protein [bacterium]